MPGRKLNNIFMTHNIDINNITNILEDCANTYIVPRFRNLDASDIHTKKHLNDFVTIADIETEEALCRILPTVVPGCLVIGEEGVSSGKITTDPLKDPSQIIFVVDPVDGTYNFKNGSTDFALMMSLVINGATQAAWIYDVMNKAHYTAQKGKGAFVNGNPLSVAGKKDIVNAKGFMEYHNFKQEIQDILKKQGADRFKSMRCAGHEYINIARGDADFSIFTHMNPWDHLAGVLLVEEAGGAIRKFNGSPYGITDQKGGIVVASNMNMFEQIRTQFILPTMNAWDNPKP